jgi:hypothetical protein
VIAALSRVILRYAGVAAATALIGCDAHDTSYIPFALTAYDVHFYDKREGREFYVGRVSANYFTRNDGLAKANALAHDEARRRRLLSEEWSYVACTVTASSSCVTKVR